MLNRINRNLHSLTTAERKVANWVLQNPHQVVTGPLARIAAAIGVSEPTVVRFCRSMGSSGFSDFKMRLAQNLATSEHTVHADVAADDDATEIIAKVIGRSIRDLNGVQQRLNPNVIDAVTDALFKANRIDFYGVGASGIVVSDAQNKFFRLGIPCNAYFDSPTILQAAAITDSQYAVIAVSKTGESKAVVDACKKARLNETKVIAITSPLSSLANTADLTVLVDIDEDTGLYTPMSSRLAQLAVLDVLQVAFALRLGNTAIRKLDQAKAALR